MQILSVTISLILSSANLTVWGSRILVHIFTLLFIIYTLWIFALGYFENNWWLTSLNKKNGQIYGIGRNKSTRNGICYFT